MSIYGLSISFFKSISRRISQILRHFLLCAGAKTHRMSPSTGELVLIFTEFMLFRFEAFRPEVHARRERDLYDDYPPPRRPPHHPYYEDDDDVYAPRLRTRGLLMEDPYELVPFMAISIVTNQLYYCVLMHRHCNTQTFDVKKCWPFSVVVIV